MHPSHAISELQQLSSQLLLASSGQVRTADLVQSARNSTALTQALPERYSHVLHDILDRLESGALFTEVSCSFSQQELLSSLATWVDMARSALTSLTAPE